MKKTILSAALLIPLLVAAQTSPTTAPSTPESRAAVAERAAAQALRRAADAERQARAADRRAAMAQQSAKETADDLKALRKDMVSTSARLDVAASSTGAQVKELQRNQSALQASTNERGEKVDAALQAQQDSLIVRSALFVALLALATFGLAGWGWSRQRKNGQVFAQLDDRLTDVAKAARASEERAAKTDTSIASTLFEVLAQLRAQAEALTNTPTAKNQVSAEPDHNLPIKLADEIHRMNKRLATLPEDTKGLTPLKKSLERLVSELEAYGYEIMDHTGKAYTENMSVKARFVPSEDLAPDERVIHKVIVPQLNHQGVMVRMADVEVSIGS